MWKSRRRRGPVTPAASPARRGWVFALLLAGCGAASSAVTAPPDPPADPPPGRPADPTPSLPALGTATSFDVATWNVEWFGDRTRGPSDEALQLQRVRDVIRGLELDLWGVQEIVDPAHFASLVGQLPGYRGLLASDPSVQSGPAHYSDFGGLEQRVGIVYREEVVEVLSASLLVTDKDYEFAGRPPLAVRIAIRLGGTMVEGTVVVLHAKAGADAESRDRREAGARALKDHLDATRSGERIWVIGDFNDDMDVSILAGGLSPYRNFVEDGTRWLVPTRALSLGGITASLGYPDLIDHHVVSDEVASGYEGASAQVPRLDQQIPAFGETVSDHLPVVARYRIP